MSPTADATSPAAALDFMVRRDDLRQVRCLPVACPQPGADEILLEVERFALTANNITYAVFGEAMQYWAYFPRVQGWGCVPVWGFARVLQSNVPAVEVGERVYGYLPMSTHLCLQPQRLSPLGFTDGTAHRAKLPAAYQRYSRISRDPRHDIAHEDQQALLWPLFMTSFLIADLLAEHTLFGGKAVLLSSASSKTALGLAQCLQASRPGNCRIIGLTSAANRGFCERSGYYDQVLEYGALPTLDASLDCVYVDMSGNGRLLHDLHHHFGEHLRYSCMVGGTHWEQRETQHALPGAKPTFFFAPDRIRKRQQDWGPGGVEQRFAQAWQGFLPTVSGWLQIARAQGAAAVEARYRELLEGRTPPETGHILRL